MNPRLVSMMLVAGIIAQLGGCAAAREFAPDTSLLRPWKFGALDVCEDPCVARYSSGNKELAFVASKHENNLSSDSFQVIKNEFQRFKPQIVIIEGISFSRGFSPKRYLKRNME